MVGENCFYIRKFSAFSASNIFTQVAKVVTPIAGSLLPLLGMVGNNGKLMDIDLSDAAPSLAGLFDNVSGDVVEILLKELLIKHENVSYDDPHTGRTTKLTEDAANELFCGETQDMFLLAVEVVKLNYSGFFRKLKDQFGDALTEAMNRLGQTSSPSMENLTPPASLN